MESISLRNKKMLTDIVHCRNHGRWQNPCAQSLQWEVCIGWPPLKQVSFFSASYSLHSLDISLPSSMSIQVCISSIISPFYTRRRPNSRFLAFAPFEDDKKRYSLLAQKIVYIIIQFAALLIGAYKLAKYGLLPTTAADWLPWYHVSLVCLLLSHFWTITSEDFF